MKAALRKVVFPAHAGMARKKEQLRALRDGFPRPRGDGPEIAA